MTHIRFYAVEPKCFFSRVVHFLGELAGYDMQTVHCALEWDGFVNDFTSDGIGYYTIEEDEEHRKPVVQVEIAIDKALLYERAMLLANLDLKLNLWSLVKKMLRLPMTRRDLLCTDYVQLLLEEEIMHYSAMEYLEHLIFDSMVEPVYTEDDLN